MPITRSRAAAAPTDERQRCAAAIDISSDSDAGSEDDDDEEEEVASTDDEDYVDISDDADDEEEESEAEVEESVVDRSEAACNKITHLLQNNHLSGRNLDGIKLVECKAYLRKNGLSQTGDRATCIERIMLHWRFKDGDPVKLYPRSSFCIDCKGDVCRGDAVLFKQKVYDKRGKRCVQCIGKRIVCGKVIKESYGKEKQQHTFTIQVFWSKGVSKLSPLHLLLIKGRNLYRMMTFRQPWPNEAERLKVLEEKHMRGDAARHVRALNGRSSAVPKCKKPMERGQRRSQSGQSDGQSSIKQGKKRVMRSSNFDLPTNRSRKEERQASSGKNCTGGSRAKTNRATLDKTNCTGRSSQCNADAKTNHVTLQKNCHRAPLHKGSSGREVRMSKRTAASGQNNTVGSSHAQFEGRSIGSASHSQANHRNLHEIQQPCFEMTQGPPPLHGVGSFWQPHINRRSIACPNPPGVLCKTTAGFQHPNAALADCRTPVYIMGAGPNPLRAVFPAFNVPRSVHHSHPEAPHLMPQFGFPGSSNGFHR